jgi:hypothetical protein
MLRRDPTTIHLVADDIRDIGRNIEFNLSTDSQRQTNNDLIINQHDIDNQNWDSSVDESYLGSRGRERDYEFDLTTHLERMKDLQRQSQTNNIKEGKNVSEFDSQYHHDINESKNDYNGDQQIRNDGHGIDDVSLLGSLADSETTRKR